MSASITGVVTNGVVVPDSALPEGMRVEIRLIADEVQGTNPPLHFPAHLDANDPVEREFLEEQARRLREDLEIVIPARSLRDQSNNND